MSKSVSQGKVVRESLKKLKTIIYFLIILLDISDLFLSGFSFSNYFSVFVMKIIPVLFENEDLTPGHALVLRGKKVCITHTLPSQAHV